MGRTGPVTQYTFITPRNLSNLTGQVAVNGTLAVGMTMVILLAGIDLSVGSVCGFTAMACAVKIHRNHWDPWAALALALAYGVAIGLFNGAWTARYRIHPFLTTLATMTIARGLALRISEGRATPMDNAFWQLGSGYFGLKECAAVIAIGIASWLGYWSWAMRKGALLAAEGTRGVIAQGSWLLVVSGLILYVARGYGLPMAAGIFFVVAIIAGFILRGTTFGRHIYAVGGNPEAARLAGVRVGNVILATFGIMGLLTAVAGIIMAARVNAVEPAAGQTFELDAIAAVVIGGTSLMGGVGSVSGSVIGALVIGVMNNGLSLMNVPSEQQYILKGLIVVFAVWMDARARRGRE